MKNRTVSVLALLCAVAALLLSGASLYLQKQQPNHTVALSALEEQNSQLQAQIDALSARLDAAGALGLESWALTPTALADGSGALVEFTAVPRSQDPDLEAQLVVLLEGKSVAAAPCGLEGGQLTASVQLSAANGYSYYCLLTSASSDQQRIPLVTPESPVETLVYLADSLSTHCSLTVDGFRREADALILDSCCLQLQLPSLTPPGSAAQYSRSQLVFCCNGSALTSQTVVLEAGEAANAYEYQASGLRFALPQLEEGDTLELLLEVILSDGTAVTVSGSSWFLENGELLEAVG